ncbi:MAG: hypothetical protein UMR38_08145 [Candidatus Izemoplasma sp.]|nr:hypothetical protein [Candidatus Izemoplasma sp.]
MTVLTTQEMIDEVLHKEFVMIIAKSHSCTICNTIENTLIRNVSNLDKIERYAIYIDDIDQFRGDHLIFSVPTVLIFSEGKELLRESRYINYNKIARLIDMYHS